MKVVSSHGFWRLSKKVFSASVLGLAAMAFGQSANADPLILYSGQHAKTTQKVVDAFTKSTGIEVQIRRGNSSQLANQIIEEGQRSPADVFYAEESPPLAALAQRGLLATLPEETLAQVRPTYTANDGSWTGVTARSRVTIFNQDLIDEADLPESILDMASPEWEGRFAFVPTSGAFQQQIIAVKELHGREAGLA